MRSEQEMYELIVGVAKNDDRILGGLFKWVQSEI